MPISLTAKAEKIGQQRRKVAELQSKRESLLKSFTEKETELDNLQSKLDGWKEGDADSKESIASSINSTREEMSKLRSQCLASSDSVNSERATLTSLEEDYRMIESHNETEHSLSNSARHTIGGDGASLGSNVFNGGAGSSGARDVRVLPPTSEQIDHDFGQYLQCQMIATFDRMSPDQVVSMAQNVFKNDRVASVLSSAMQANTHSAGGSLIAGAFMPRVIELLRAKAIVRASGVPTVPLDDGSMTIPAITGGSSSTYIGEGVDADITAITTGDIKLVAKEMVTMIPTSEKLMRSPSANASQIVRNDMIRSAALCEDLYFIRGVAGGAGPQGMRYLAASANVLTMTSSPNLANVTTDAGRMELALMAANVGMTNCHWAMAPRVYIYLMSLRDGNGNVAFPELANMMWRNKPVHLTTQIPITLGGGTESEVYLYDADELVIGDAPQMSLEASNVAAYNNGGTLVSAFSRRQVITRLVIENDFQARHREAIAVLTGVTWGAT